MLKVSQFTVFREEFDDSSLLFDPATGKTFYLNNVATFILQQIYLGCRIDEIEIEVRSKFSKNISPDVKSDIHAFVKSLEENGFLEYEV